MNGRLAEESLRAVETLCAKGPAPRNVILAKRGTLVLADTTVSGAAGKPPRFLALLGDDNVCSLPNWELVPKQIERCSSLQARGMGGHALLVSCVCSSYLFQPKDSLDPADNLIDEGCASRNCGTLVHSPSQEKKCQERSGP